FRASFCCVASSVSQATYGAETHPALTSKLDHLVGADHLHMALRSSLPGIAAERSLAPQTVRNSLQSGLMIHYRAADAAMRQAG
ncbi:hypothetical protein, partial [Methylobacterium oxalidis]|uniref:hypothetical protein n=1 Tax=Methylobacterium oxalidis TaxID=944322 RepID=UPI0024E0FA85